MAATTKVWVDDTTPSVNAVDLNGFKNENNNLIVGSGQSLNIGNLQQTHIAVSQLVGAADFFSSTGTNTIILSSTGSLQGPIALLPGQRVRWLGNANNTGAVQINVNGIGLTPLVDREGNAITAGMITVGNMIEAQFDGTTNFVLTSITNNLRIGSDRFRVNMGASGVTQLDINATTDISIFRSDGATGGILTLTPVIASISLTGSDVFDAIATSTILRFGGNIVFDSNATETKIAFGTGGFATNVSGSVMSANNNVTNVTVLASNGTTFLNNSVSTMTINSTVVETLVIGRVAGQAQFSSGTLAAPGIALTSFTAAGFRDNGSGTIGVGIEISSVGTDCGSFKQISGAPSGESPGWGPISNRSQNFLQGIQILTFQGEATNIVCGDLNSAANISTLVCTRTASGIYSLTHGFGDVLYSIVLMASTTLQGGGSSMISAQAVAGTTTVQVIEFRDDAGALVNPAFFSILIIRNNT